MSVKSTILSRKFQVLFLVFICLSYSVIQVAVFKQTLTSAFLVIGLMLLCFLLIGGILYWILNAKQLKTDTPPWISYMSTYRLSVGIFLLCMSFQPSTVKHEYDSSSDGVYASSITHHCQWCGKEYHHTGYFHVEKECVHPKEDIGTDECCSEKCCWDSWNSKRN